MLVVKDDKWNRKFRFDRQFLQKVGLTENQEKFLREEVTRQLEQMRTVYTKTLVPVCQKSEFFDMLLGQGVQAFLARIDVMLRVLNDIPEEGDDLQVFYQEREKVLLTLKREYAKKLNFIV